ncbi:MAG: DNA cytosine methyltransferase [Acidobacteriales bacterium]|nr:DNA cytosine methyltransferase [Terriglobales bacterium]
MNQDMSSNGNTLQHAPLTLALFSGGGGFDLGFSAAGFNIFLSTDIDELSCSTHVANFSKRPYYSSHHVLCEDITKLDPKILCKKFAVVKSSIDVIIGGPPCQAFSVFGRRKGLADPRGNLVWEFLKFIEQLQPKVFVFENVSGLKTIHDGTLYGEIRKRLTCGGTYAISEHHYQMAEFGIPQFRDRVFFIGWKGGRVIPPMCPTHGTNLFSSRPFVTVEDALRGLSEPGVAFDIPNHVGREHSERIIKRYRNLKFGERDPKTRINKLHPNKPSFTIIVGSDAGGGKGHVHPHSPREVTPRESARIQTFPDWWEFSGTGRHVIRQVGNAVPPLFAALLGSYILECIFEYGDGPDYEGMLERLELDNLHSDDYRPLQPQDSLQRTGMARQTR